MRIFLALLLALLLAGCSLGYNLHDRYTFDLVDAGPDAGLDAGPEDSGIDASLADSGADSGVDAGDPDAGGLPPCDPTRELCRVEEVCAGATFACARTEGGEVYCWGENDLGQVGVAPSEAETRPIRLVGADGPITGVVGLGCGRDHACLLTGAGEVLCWGSNRFGQLGDGGSEDHHEPRSVVDLDDVTVVEVVVGESNSCAVLSNRRIRCWGVNGAGQLGVAVARGGFQSRPVANPEIYPADQLGVGYSFMCARAGGNVSCWGSGISGQLGNGVRDFFTSPVDVVGVADAVSLAVGSEHSCIARRDGTVWCWGRNDAYQLGNDRSSLESIPVQVEGVSGATWTSAFFHSCGGSPTYCWGYRNDYGQLGGGNADLTTSPVQVEVLPEGTAPIVPGFLFSCARLASGSVQCWGRNHAGQLGDGTTVQRILPSPVVAP